MATVFKQTDVEAVVNSANANLRLGSGVFAFPPMLAAQIMADTLAKADALAPHLMRVCVVSEHLRDLYTSAFEAAGLNCTSNVTM